MIIIYKYLIFTALAYIYIGYEIYTAPSEIDLWGKEVD
jgi:hypothetical protein